MGENRAEAGCCDCGDEVFNGGFMKLMAYQDVFEKGVQVEEGLLFSPPYSSSSSSSSSSSACCYPQMLHFGGGHEEFLLFNTDNSYSLSAAAAALSPTGRSRARASKKVETNGGGGLLKVASNGKPKAGSAGKIKIRQPTVNFSQKSVITVVLRGSTLIHVSKEKLGERISALQQLISPFGKTDTATVLHEAIGYIRFLHDQVQEEEKGDLRSRGLCLVPVSCTEDVANNNIGADLWPPAAAAMGGRGSSSSSSGLKH